MTQPTVAFLVCSNKALTLPHSDNPLWLSL
jgi:hypothetical protein